MKRAIKWAEQNQIKWAFSDRNAGTYFASFYNDIKDIIEVNWDAVKATNFKDFLVKEGKQAEFLIHDICAWQLIEKIGVLNQKMLDKVNSLLENSKYKPVVAIEKSWYY
jgi:hypothetical protein